MFRGLDAGCGFVHLSLGVRWVTCRSGASIYVRVTNGQVPASSDAVHFATAIYGFVHAKDSSLSFLMLSI